MIAGDWLIMGKFISPNIDNNIKVSKLTSVKKVKEKLSEVEGGLGLEWQEKLQAMLDEGPNIVAQPVSTFNIEELLLDAGSGDEDEDGQRLSEVAGKRSSAL